MNHGSIKNRYFASDSPDEKERRKEFGVKNLFRYKDYFAISEKEALQLFDSIPFLNGGLFECLDKDLVGENEGKPQTTHYVFLDGFSREEEYSAHVPDFLFFGKETEKDLSKELDDKKRNNAKVKGLINILHNYKFTIEENTSLEEDVALDPELLGKIFENLLAAYNPETSTTARKQTGSFYTPREIVDYMVEESLIAYFKTVLTKESVGHSVMGTNENTMFPEAVHKKGQQFFTTPIESNPWKGKENALEEKLRSLFAKEIENPFSDKDTKQLVSSLQQIKILDPACGSGAFPMGILNRMVHILQKLDKTNQLWEKIQIEYHTEETKEQIASIEKDTKKAKEISLKEAQEIALKVLEEKKQEIQNAFHKQLPDYARKLYLIENCIYGVDIQPIAVQISKLRFFISLIIDQKLDDNAPNRGILSLPNLETKFVADNTLIGLDLPKSDSLITADEFKMEREEIASIRHLYFKAKHRDEKKRLEKREKEIRKQIQNTILEKDIKKIKEIIQLLDGKKLTTGVVKNLKQIIEDRKIDPKKIVESIESLPKEFDPGFKKKALEQARAIVSTDSAEQIANWDPYDQNAHANWFDPQWMFGMKNGFDVVIGNPPYVQLQNTTIDSKILEYYKSNYQSAKYKIDLYHLFIELGIKLLSTNGVITYIVPNTFTKNKFADSLRSFIVNNTNIICVLNFFIKVFEDPSVDNLVFVSQRCKSAKNNIKIFDIKDSLENDLKHFRYFPQTEISKSNYIFEFNILDNKLIKKINEHSVIFKTIGGTYFGIQTFDRNSYVKKVKVNKHYLPVIDGGNVHRYFYNPPTEFVDFRSESIKSGGKAEIYKLERILVRQIGKYPEGTLSQENILTLNTIYNLFITNSSVKIKYCLGILNSKVISYYWLSRFFDDKESFPKIKKDFLEQLPIPRSPIDNPKLQQPLITLLDKILAAKGKDPLADTSKWENEIDARVFHLYGLTEEEMLTVLNSFPKMSIVEKDLIVKFYREIK